MVSVVLVVLVLGLKCRLGSHGESGVYSFAKTPFRAAKAPLATARIIHGEDLGFEEVGVAIVLFMELDRTAGKLFTSEGDIR